MMIMMMIVIKLNKCYLPVILVIQQEVAHGILLAMKITTCLDQIQRFVNPMSCDITTKISQLHVYVVVQFYPWFKFYFLLF